MKSDNNYKRNLLAQWAFDTSPILGRFHIWLEDIEVEWVKGEVKDEFTRNISFLNGKLERMFALSGAITALGTQLFGRFGEGKDLDKTGLNHVKKDADAISAYALSESLWYLSRHLPENHAIMVSLGEGLMPKAGETPEMGSNPQLGFGRVYARPEVAKYLDGLVIKLLNDENYNWSCFYKDLRTSGITVWGTAIDTLENTSRFAKGKETGPMTVIHLFDQPLKVTKPYEGYIGNIFLTSEVAKRAEKDSIFISFRTKRRQIVEIIEKTYPGIKRENIHVWTLRGKSREVRLGRLWKEWSDLGVHLVETGWKMPSGMEAFTDSGTYAPVYSVSSWKDENGETNLFICDGYAASAEAVQAASLAPSLGIRAYLTILTSNFKNSYDIENNIMSLDWKNENFVKNLKTVLRKENIDKETVDVYKNMIIQASEAGIPVHKGNINADDFMPEKEWSMLAISGFMKTDPYSGFKGVKEISPGSYRVGVRLLSRNGEKIIYFTLKLLESFKESKLVFNPLLNRFLAGENYKERPVKISDSGRIRNELQTLCSDALEFQEDEKIILHLSMISDDVISPDDQKKIKEILHWYLKEHPIWFSWLVLSDM